MRLGYDPRKSPESKKYQMLDFRIRCSTRHGKQPGGSRRFELIRAKHMGECHGKGWFSVGRAGYIVLIGDSGGSGLLLIGFSLPAMVGVQGQCTHCVSTSA